MKENIIKYLRDAFPFLLVLALWRLSGRIFNPAGILALIPVFFCTFIKPVPWFGLYSVIFCFLIDYKSDTLVFWTALYCLFYAVTGFQTFVDLTRMDKNALNAFMLFVGIGLVLLTLFNFTFSGLLRNIFIFTLASLLYFPVTELITRVQND